jgi:hypothetical protein
MNGGNKWIIQSTGFETSYLVEVIEALNNNNIEFNDFGIIKDEITNLEEILLGDGTLILRGSTKMLSLLQGSLSNKISKEDTTRLRNSLDFNEKNFDMEYYSTLGLPLLNDNGNIYQIKDILYYEFEKEHFIKPTKDSKAFNGGIIHSGETLMNYLMRTPHRNIEEIKNDNMIVAELQDIESEYRFFMYKDTILGSSRYILNGKVLPDVFVPLEVKEKAKEYGKLYNPAEIYVIDLCIFKNSDEIKIVEYNCWNCSGFYHCDINAIVKSINIIKGIL